MAKQYRCVYFIAIFIGVLLASQAGAYTDPIDVAALEELYNTLNQPPQLTGWRLDGGDPCDESWNGVSCSGSSVIYLKLHGLNLSGYITARLYNLYNLKQLDISSNSIGGEIPFVLPPNATHINMACNFFTQNIPLSLHGMKSLQYLNLSHNLLSGPIGNVFAGLQNLREMDLSYNNFTGDLPTSFGSLTNLTGLYLQNNQFTGSVAYLAELPQTHVTHLDLSYNNFTGDVPSSFGSLTNLTGLYLKNNKFTGSVASLAELPPTDMKLENYSTGLVSLLFLGASLVFLIGCCMAAPHGEPPQQPAPAPVAADLIANPNRFCPKFTKEKANSPLCQRFESREYQLEAGGKVYIGESASKVKKLAYPDQQKVKKPMRRLSFINEKDEVEEYTVDDNEELG